MTLTALRVINNGNSFLFYTKIVESMLNCVSVSDIVCRIGFPQVGVGIN